MKRKLKIEIVAAVAAVLTGVLLGENEFGRNLISGVVSAVVFVVVFEIWSRYRDRSSEKKK